MTGSPNLFAGMGSHQSAQSQTDTWFSPPAILEALGGADSFDLDPCSPADRPWPTARQHYSEADNGLQLPWIGRVWLNPPYRIDLITRFLGRMAEHDRGVALIFARTETDPFHRFVWGAASGLLFLRGRLNFHRADGSRASANGGAPSVLIASGRNEPIELAELYRAFARHPKTAANRHWRDKLRQVLQRGTFERVDKGLWRRRAA